MFKRLLKRKRYFNVSFYIEGVEERKNGATSTITRFGSIPVMNTRGGVPSRSTIIQQLQSEGLYKEISWMAIIAISEFESKADYLEFQQ